VSRRYTRAALIGTATVVGAGIAGVRLTSGGGRVTPPPGPAPSRHAVETDFPGRPDGSGWGDGWLPVHYDRELDIQDGRGRYAVPQGLRETAADQTMPVMRRDFVHADGEQMLELTTDDATLRPGVLLRATAPFRYASVTLENGELVVADNEFDGRAERGRASTTPLLAGRPHGLRVRYLGGRLWARAWPLGSAEPGWQIEAAIHTAGAGDPGVLTVHPTSLRACTLSVRRHRAVTDQVPLPTPPVCPVLVAGIPEPTAAGGHRLALRAWCTQPAGMRFEWSETGPAGPFAHGPKQDARSGPYTGSQVVDVTGRRLDWRVRTWSATSGAEAVTPLHRIDIPDTGEGLTLLAASCYKLIGADRNRGFQRLGGAAAQTPAGLVFEGDLGYPGNWRDAVYHRSTDFFADRFQRALADPGFVELRRSVPVGFVMDDHDYGPDNGADRTTVLPWTISLWDRITAGAPAAGYFDFRIGDVHCLTLDGRRYCDPVTEPNTPAKTRLGMRQRAWMEDILRGSDARLFVLFSADMFGSRWNDGTGRRTLDCYLYGWPDEYRWAMTLFTDIQLTGRRVLIVSGDCHSLRINRHPDPGGRSAAAGHPVIEFVCSGIRAELWEEAAPGDPMVDRRRYRVGQSGAGLVEIDPVGAAGRSITLRAIAASGSGLDAWPPLVLPFAP
jgi:PhoD-like phosphatase